MTGARNVLRYPITEVWRQFPHPSEAESIRRAVDHLRASNPDAIIRFTCADGSVYAGDVPDSVSNGRILP